MAESMRDFEQELEASFKKIDEGDIITGTVVSVDETGVVLDLKYYTEGFIPAEEFSREPGFNLKEAVQPGKRSRQLFSGKTTDRAISCFQELRQQRFWHGRSLLNFRSQEKHWMLL